MTATPQPFTDSKVWKLISPLKKRHWYERGRLKSIKNVDDWSDMYIALCQVGFITDERFQRSVPLHRLILEKDFNTQSEWNLSRGRCQAYSYRKNRITENAARFLRSAKDTHRAGHDFRIEHFLPVSKYSDRHYRSTPLGWVVASDGDDAQRVADMLYSPFFPKKDEEDRDQVRIDSSERIPILYGDRSEFISLMAQSAEKIRKARAQIEKSIRDLEQKIDENKLMEDCLNLNLCAFGQDES